MPPFFTIEADPSAVDAAFARFPEALARVVDAIASETADRLVADAKARVARRTGVTAAEIHKARATAGVGYVVVSERQQLYLLPAWLEYGTGQAKRGRNKGKPGMPARPYFGPSVQIEAPGHERRIRDAVVQVIDEMGLGD